ncbi:sensor domain-containing diguanylate cyclase [Amedibacillus sp. YH-ame10]
MKLPLSKNKNTKIVCILLVLFSLAGLSFFDYAFKNDMHTSDYIHNMAEKVNNNLSLTLRNKLKDTELILTSLALQASAFDDIEDPVMMDVLYEQSVADNYLNLSITTTDGITTHAINGETENTSDRAFFKEVMSGKIYVSNKTFSNSKNNDFVVMSVPIWKNDKVIGIIGSTIDTNMFTNFLQMSMSDEGQNAILVEKDGTIISKTKDVASDNFFSGLMSSVLEDKSSLKKIEEDFANKKSGIIHYSFEGNKQLAYYCEIEDSDWMIVSIFPHRIISSQVDKTYNNTLLFTVKLIILLIVALFLIAYYERKATKEVQVINQQLDAIIDNTPGCLIMYEYHNRKNIKFLNDEFANLSGYSKTEFEQTFDNDLALIIHPEDIKELQEKLKLDVHHNDYDCAFSYSYRIVHKNGNIIWVMDRRHIVRDSHGILWFNINLVDITEMKNVQQKLLISQQRYKMIIEQTEFVVFEWDVLRDTITFSDLWTKKFGYELEYRNFLSITAHYCEQCSDTYMPLLNAFIKGEQEQGFIECKLKKATGEYIWCKITARAIKDSAGYIMRVYGSIEDIDAQKANTLILEERSKMDGLTKILNKMTGEQEIQEAIDRNPNHHHVLFVIDIDDFKNVNDTMGHAVGDHVLQELGIAIKQSFRNSDILSRIGGDEFVALVENVEMLYEDVVKVRTEQLHEAISSIALNGDSISNITCSVGIALYPQHGTTYQELFVNADKALYIAKNSGKNQYHIYNKEEE